MSSDAPRARRFPDDGAPDPPTVLAHRGTYPWDAVLAYLGARAVTGIERVDAGVYLRVLPGRAGTRDLSVRPLDRGGGFEVRVVGPPVPAAGVPVGPGKHAVDRGAGTVGGRAPRRTADDPTAWLPRVIALFAVDARWRAAARHLADDPLLAPSFARWPGLRVPGAWDGFEWAVRVVLGQHVSVRAASTFTERLVTRFGESAAPGAPGRLFPSPGRLSRAQIEVIGVTRGRAGAVRALAAAVTEDPSMLAAGGDPATLRARLLALPGIGPWTAEVVAMRALADADAFPAGDLVLRRAAGGLGGTELRRRAERWRPYRAYAAMALWWGVAHRP